MKKSSHHHSDQEPKYITEAKDSWLRSQYPAEDVDRTDMFKPFWRRKRTWLVLLAVMLSALCYFFLPLDKEALSEDGLEPEMVRRGLSVFVLIAALWLTEAMSLAATALLVPVVAALFGLSPMENTLKSFAHPLIFLFLGGFALASAMAYQGIDRWIAGKLIRLGGGGFIPVALLMFSGTALLSMWMSNTATAAMMVPLVIGVLRQLPKEAIKHKGNAYFMLLGVAYSASIGGMGSLVGSPPNGIAASALGVSFLGWLKVGLPAVLLLLPLMWLVLFSLCKPTRGVRVEFPEEKFRFNKQRVTMLVLFAFTALGWVFSRQLGTLVGVAKGMDTMVALLAIFLLLFLRVVRWRDIEKGSDWGVLLLFGGGIALSGVLGSSGASAFLAGQLESLVRQWPALALALAVTLFVIFLTELSSNTASAALLVPIFVTVATDIGLEASALVVPLALAASCAFMLPVATPPNAIIFATKKVPQREMMKVGLVLNIVFALALAVYAKLWLM
ncbi:sodium-dependent dicarboxylate transporter SdcS [Rubritalea halochordaticola]|uniref:Sodium-dependent dicarboxylate transporter SdcS n=1 Tax=Rubritalea halochordaticola TaxID=714537 RepID=A0ABP9V3V9_9BACT